MRDLFFVTFISLLLSCVSERSPEAHLRLFEAELAKGTLSQEGLNVWLTSDALEDFDIKNFLKNKTYLKKFKVIYSNCLKTTCSITYDVSYSFKKDGIDAVMDVRKQSVLKRQEEQSWLIDDIDIIKSYIDNKIPIKVQ